MPLSEMLGPRSATGARAHGAVRFSVWVVTLTTAFHANYDRRNISNNCNSNN